MTLNSIPDLVIEGGYVKEKHTGRNLVLRGINLAGDAKNPVTSSKLSDGESFWDGENVSYVNRPFSLDEAGAHFQRLKTLGFNVIRFIFTWEALEHKGPGIYDEEYISYVIELLKKLKNYDMYAFMDPHQDNWSRYCGGSGAPLWTLYSVGLDPKNLDTTQAAILYQSPAARDNNDMKMLWSSNYDRFACQLMFTLFFAGKDFAPKCILNNMNIQDYLQSSYLNAIKHFANRLLDAGLDQEVVLGWESMNEPNGGLIGHSDLKSIPADQHVKLGSSPTAFQSMLLASGETVSGIEEWTFSSWGPKKLSSSSSSDGNNSSSGVTISPKHSAWLSSSQRDDWDSHYNWTRSSDWKAEECIWALHGVWNPTTKRLLKPQFFAYDPSGKPFENRERAFVDRYFVDHWLKFASTIREVSKKNWILFIQPPVNCAPPNLVSNNVLADESRLIYTPHYYDGMTLMLKRWSRIFNVDALGVLRKRYISPIFALRLGERWIRTCLASQLSYIKTEGESRLGNIPCLVSEIGIPYDMDDKLAYSTKDYTSQIRAMDAISSALESAKLSHTLWVYTAENTHELGDNWNGEDLSIYSKDDTEQDGGIRAIEAVDRPFPWVVSGTPTNYEFNIQKATFTMTIEDSKDEYPTVIFLPEYYFPEKETGVSTTSGTWEIDSSNNTFIWSHGIGTQTLQIKGIAHFKV